MALFEGLDDVAWHSLSHAYGPADDVPGLLRNLASDDANVRSEAMHALYGNIWHQGTVYEATAFAVPFLLELVQDESIAARHEILVLLVHLAQGNSYLDVHQHLPTFDQLPMFDKESAEFKEQIAWELGWVQASYMAVRDGLPIYRRLLEHPESDLRAAAAYTLSCLLDPAAFDGVVPVLLARLESETDDGARASLIHGLGLQVGVRMARDGSTSGEVLSYADVVAEIVRSETESDLVRLVAAMALATIAPASPVHAKLAADRLLAMLGDRSEEVAEGYRRLPWADEDVAGEVCGSLAELDQSVAGFSFIPAFLQALQAADALTALTIAQALLHLAFRDGPDSWSADVQRLTEDQRAILEALAQEDSPCWGFNGNMALMLRAYGLPDWPDKLQAMLAPRPS